MNSNLKIWWWWVVNSLYFCVEFTRIYRQYWCNIFVRKAIFHYSNRTIVMNEEDFFIGYPGFNFNIEILSQHYIKKSTYTSFIFEFVVETSSWSFSISLCTESRSDMIIEYSCKVCHLSTIQNNSATTLEKSTSFPLWHQQQNNCHAVLSLTCIAAFRSSVSRLISLLACEEFCEWKWVWPRVLRTCYFQKSPALIKIKVPMDTHMLVACVV